jgi:hypothetical protein
MTLSQVPCKVIVIALSIRMQIHAQILRIHQNLCYSLFFEFLKKFAKQKLSAMAEFECDANSDEVFKKKSFHSETKACYNFVLSGCSSAG